MNKLTQRLISSIMAGLLLAALIPASAFAQIANPQAPAIRHQAPAVKPRPDLVRILKRQPRSFKQFEMRNPKTNAPIAPNSEVTLPNGKKMTAQQYFDQLNQFEKKLNETGYSLRDPQDKTKIQETNINRAALQQKAQSISAARARTSISKVAPLAMQDFQKNLAETKLSPQQSQVAVAGFVKASPVTVHTEKVWGYSVGDRSVLAAYFKAKLVLDGSKDVTSVSAEADAGGSIFDYTQSFLRLTASLTAPKTGSMNAKVNAYVLGVSVYNLNQSAPTSWSKSDSVSKLLDLSTPTLSFPLGPISVSAKVGTHGSSGVSYSAGLNQLSAVGWVVPKVSSTVYAQAGIDIGAFGVNIAGAGVRGNLTLLNYQLALVGQCSIRVDSLNKPYFFEVFAAREQIESLTGNLELYAYVYVPCWDWPPACKKEYTWDFWPSEGLKSDDWIFNDSKKTYIPGA